MKVCQLSTIWTWNFKSIIMLLSHIFGIKLLVDNKWSFSLIVCLTESFPRNRTAPCEELQWWLSPSKVQERDNCSQLALAAMSFLALLKITSTVDSAYSYLSPCIQSQQTFSHSSKNHFLYRIIHLHFSLS